jgi:hypothetical protein
MKLTYNITKQPSDIYHLDFMDNGKRVRKSLSTKDKTVAKERGREYIEAYNYSVSSKSTLQGPFRLRKYIEWYKIFVNRK